MRSRLRQSEKPEPMIRLESNGFSVIQDNEVGFHLVWADVREVVAYKEDLFGYDDICVGFRLDDTDQYFRVTEEFIHYEELLQELPRRFPGIRTDWFNDVAFPAFVPNWTTLWGEPLRAQDRESEKQGDPHFGQDVCATEQRRKRLRRIAFALIAIGLPFSGFGPTLLISEESYLRSGAGSLCFGSGLTILSFCAFRFRKPYADSPPELSAFLFGYLGCIALGVAAWRLYAAISH
jgi:hypothetical protein